VSPRDRRLPPRRSSLSPTMRQGFYGGDQLRMLHKVRGGQLVSQWGYTFWG
jgi:hypothetical protein